MVVNAVVYEVVVVMVVIKVVAVVIVIMVVFCISGGGNSGGGSAGRGGSLLFRLFGKKFKIYIWHTLLLPIGKKIGLTVHQTVKISDYDLRCFSISFYRVFHVRCLLKNRYISAP